MMEDYLKLDKQLCFSLYVLHREIMQQYRPILDEIGLTYPQYITLMALWEKDGLTVNQLGEQLKLDNGTLTPLLKRLEAKKLLTRTRSKSDERVVEISLTDEGRKLKEKATCVPSQILTALNLEIEEMHALKTLSDKVFEGTKKI
ncbi:MAG: MarR family transcriptional regulator [Flavobacteriales bacterium]|nr:MAG: MarR family transcriptional regulator [Flavobacteriales bacterium]